MADELKLNFNLRFTKGGASVRVSDNVSVDVTGDAYTAGVQEIGFAAEEEIAQGADLGTPGYVVIRNLDALNYIMVGATTLVYCVRVNAGEFAIFRNNGSTLYAKAVGGNCLIEYFIFEA